VTRAATDQTLLSTVATHFYASQAIPLAGLPTPKIFITAESVKQGKPKPDPYRAWPSVALPCLFTPSRLTALPSGC
jgi:hypothetical protein